MNNKNSHNGGSSGGIGFCGVLTLIFVVLKLVGVINWSWVWVLSPLWIGTIVTLTIIGLIALIALIAYKK